MKNSWKRVLSAVLTVVMIASLLVVPAAAEEPAQVKVWNLNGSWPDAVKGRTEVSASNTAENPATLGICDGEGNESTDPADVLKIYGGKFTFDRLGGWPQFNTGATIEVPVTVPEGNIAIVSIRSYAASAVTVDGVANTQAIQNNNTDPEEFRCAGTDGKVTIVATDNSYIGYIAVRYEEGTLNPSVAVSSPEVAATMGTDATVTASVVNGTATGWAVSVTGDAATAEVSEAGVVTVHPAQAGKATVTVTATVGGTEYTNDITVYVKPATTSEVADGDTFTFTGADGKEAFLTTGKLVFTGFQYNDASHGLRSVGTNNTVKMTIPDGKKADVTVVSCQHGSSLDADKGTVTKSSDTDPVVTITGATGELTITNGSAQAYIHSISVALMDAAADSMVVAPVSVTMRAGESKTVTATVDGYAGKSVFAMAKDATVAGATVNGTTVTINGLAAGTTKVYVYMAESALADETAVLAESSTKEVAVTVNAALAAGTQEWDFRVASAAELPDAMTGLETSGKFDYHGSQYGVTMGNTGAVAVPVEGPSKITITGGYHWEFCLGDAQDISRYGTFVGDENKGDFVGSKVGSGELIYTGGAGKVLVSAKPGGATTYIAGLKVEKLDGVTPNHVDVWDFGAEPLNTGLFTNKVDVATVAKWHNDNGVTEGNAIGSSDAISLAADGFSFEIPGSKSLRYRAVSELLKDTPMHAHDRYMLAKEAGLDPYVADADTYTPAEGDPVSGGELYTGAPTSNSGNTITAKLSLTAGDKVTFVTRENAGGAYTVKFTAPTEANSKSFDVAATGHCSNPDYITYYAPETGEYTWGFETTNKFCLARVYREAAVPVTVTGAITGTGMPEGYKIVFTDDESGATAYATISGASYTATLSNYLSGATFTVSLEDAGGFVVATGETLELELTDRAKTHDLSLVEVELANVSGAVTGLDEADLANVEFVVTPPEGKIYVPKIVVAADGTYTTQMEKGVAYTLAAKNVNDYTLTTTSLSKDADATDVAIAFAKKPVQTVTIVTDPAGVDLSAATLTFTNIDEAEVDDAHPNNYSYTFTGTDGIKLRAGQYKVELSGAPAKHKLIADLKVEAAAVSHTIKFETTPYVAAGTHSFSAIKDDSYATAVNGISFANFAAHTGGHGPVGEVKDGKPAPTMTLKLEKDATVTITSCAYGNGADVTATSGAVTDADGSESGAMTQKIFTITGAKAGDFTVTFGSTVYVHSVQVTYVGPLVTEDVTLTVGANKQYKTIQAACDAVAEMNRAEGVRATIVIDPGNYYEMVWLKAKDVTFKNASANPSIALKNKGVDIDDNAVRISWYYGCGFDYYSMGANSKFDAEQFEINKANGYVSHPNNDGGGSTDECWWNSTTVISASGFRAEGIIFENSFNQYISPAEAADIVVPNTGAKQDASKPRASLPEGSTEVQRKVYVERAAALALVNGDADGAYFENCAFVGHQDILYGGRDVRAAFYKCDLYGACDYIMGPMNAVFAKCDLVLNVGADSDKNDVAYITAAQQGTKGQVNNQGYLMYNCNIRSVEPGVENAGTAVTAYQHYLGRAWGAANAECVFYETTVGVNAEGKSLIADEGWNTGLGVGTKCTEYHTHDTATDVDYSKRIMGGVLTTPATAAGMDLSDCVAWLQGWDAFEGKNMAISGCPEQADKTDLVDAILAAEAAAEAVKTSTDGSDVATTEKWVDADTKKDLTDAITVAEAVNAKADATQEEVDAAAQAMQDALDAFNAAAKPGTKPVVSDDPIIGTGGSVASGGDTGVTVIKGDGAKSETVVNEDGSKTTTTTDAEGNKTIVTEMPDGSKTEIVSKADGEKTITVTDANGEETVSVKVPATVPAPETPFVDVPEEHWAKESIDAMAGLGLVNGVDAVNHIYDMNSDITRGALASVLYRFSNGKAGLTSNFTDVLSSAWYADGVAWADKVGVVKGYGDGTFGPEKSITRQELAVMLYRYAKLIGMDTGVKAEITRFNDSEAVASWAMDAMTWCVEAGIIKGVGGNTLNPEGVASRAECAVMLSRFIDLV